MIEPKEVSAGREIEEGEGMTKGRKVKSEKGERVECRRAEQRRVGHGGRIPHDGAPAEASPES